MGEEEVRQKIIERLENAKKRQKPAEVAKAVAEEVGMTKSEVKTILKGMAKEGKLIFTYYGSSYVELPGADKPPEV